MNALDLLTDSDLAALAAALRSGRLAAPFAAVGVQRFCPAAQAVAVAERLQQLHDEGMLPQHLALLAETALRARAGPPRQAELVDLVWTGPETPGVMNRDTGVVVRELFGAAESEVLVAGFAVYQGRAVFKRLAERMEERPGLRVRLFLDVQRHRTDTSLDAELLRRFAHRFRTLEWPGEQLPELYYDPRSLDPEAVKRSSLHAKCVIVDRRAALVTSANFTEAAHTRNIEAGALIHDGQFAARLAGHFDSLADVGLLRRLDLETTGPVSGSS
jgi:phosphatidylserine/phosphatidylglycerophosphate/cardiolipin synthase-like enzyme